MTIWSAQKKAKFTYKYLGASHWTAAAAPHEGYDGRSHAGRTKEGRPLLDVLDNHEGGVGLQGKQIL